MSRHTITLGYCAICGAILPDRSLVEVWQLGADGAISVCVECAKEPER